MTIDSIPSTQLSLTSNITSAGKLILSLETIPVPEPAEHEVLVRIEAAPINPSDLGLLFGPADVAAAKQSGTADKPVITAKVPDNFMRAVAARVGQSLPAGNEGAGTVVKAGSACEDLMGKTVAILGGACYAQYRVMKGKQCLVMNEGVTAKDGAACFVNPLTALGMVETMRMEGHSALVHTAAASNLGIMLNKICIAEGVPLVNIVRKQSQADLLTEIGAKYVCNSSSDSFKKDLYKAIEATGATLAFDAIGGGELVSDILTAMEAVGSKDAEGFNTYGSDANKQVYIYGGLDFSPTILNRAYGMTWGIGGWLLMRFLGKLAPEKVGALHHRVANEINTTFKSDFTDVLSLEEALQPEKIAQYNAKKTGEKYLINPQK